LVYIQSMTQGLNFLKVLKTPLLVLHFHFSHFLQPVECHIFLLLWSLS
jgi:hypothetical protein